MVTHVKLFAMLRFSQVFPKKGSLGGTSYDIQSGLVDPHGHSISLPKSSVIVAAPAISWALKNLYYYLYYYYNHNLYNYYILINCPNIGYNWVIVLDKRWIGVGWDIAKLIDLGFGKGLPDLLRLLGEPNPSW